MSIFCSTLIFLPKNILNKQIIIIFAFVFSYEHKYIFAFAIVRICQECEKFLNNIHRKKLADATFKRGSDFGVLALLTASDKS